MRYESGRASKKEDFLVLFSSFAQSCGWNVLKQTEIELYLHSEGGGYFQIKIDSVKYKGKIPYAWAGAVSGASGFDKNKAFEEQPGYIENNPHPGAPIVKYTSCRPQPAIIFAIKDGVNLSGYFFAGSKKTLFCIMDLGIDAYTVFFSSQIEKTHDFSGGQIIFSNYLFCEDTENHISYCTSDREYERCAPLGVSGAGCCGDTAININGVWHHFFRGANPMKIRIASNLGLKACDTLPNGDDATIPLSPLLASNISDKIETSSLSGLNPLITPQFFYKDDLDRFVHCGSLQEIKIITAAGLKHLQTLSLGDEKYIFLEQNYGYVNKDIGFRSNKKQRYGFAVRVN